jgi:hypothetical protein
MGSFVEENVEKEISLLFDGVVPERDTEIKEYINKYTPYFSLCDDRPGFTIEAGAFGILKFTSRTMHMMWILGFAANQAFKSHSSLIALLNNSGADLSTSWLNEIPDQNKEEKKYSDLINKVIELSESNNLDRYIWPSTVPKPWEGKPTDAEGAAAFDLICMSGVYVFLHEMKHIAFSFDSNAPETLQDEELQCDLFSKDLMLGRLSEYSESSGYPLNLLTTKRAMAIVLAQFFMLVITPIESWTGTNSHPSISERVTAMVGNLDLHDNDTLWLYLTSLLFAHYRHLGLGEFNISFSSYRQLSEVLMEKIEEASNKQGN